MNGIEAVWRVHSVSLADETRLHLEIFLSCAAEADFQLERFGKNRSLATGFGQWGRGLFCRDRVVCQTVAVSRVVATFLMD